MNKFFFLINEYFSGELMFGLKFRRRRFKYYARSIAACLVLYTLNEVCKIRFQVAFTNNRQ